jgi:hypothetical protein
MTGTNCRPDVTGDEDDDVPYLLACESCSIDAETFESPEAAHDAGWTGIERADHPDWNYLGTCPNCKGKKT